MIKRSQEMITQAGVCNKNGNMYTKECLEHIVESINKSDPPIFGTVGYPDPDQINDINVNLKDVAFKVENATLKDNQVFADIQVLETPKGEVLKEVLEHSNPAFRTKSLILSDHHDDELGYNIISEIKLVSLAAISAEDDAIPTEDNLNNKGDKNE